MPVPVSWSPVIPTDQSSCASYLMQNPATGAQGFLVRYAAFLIEFAANQTCSLFLSSQVQTILYSLRTKHDIASDAEVLHKHWDLRSNSALPHGSLTLDLLGGARDVNPTAFWMFWIFFNLILTHVCFRMWNLIYSLGMGTRLSLIPGFTPANTSVADFLIHKDRGYNHGCVIKSTLYSREWVFSPVDMIP
jgi:hypothetical protein